MGHYCNQVAKGGISASLHYDGVAMVQNQTYFTLEVLCLFLITIFSYHKNATEVKSTYASNLHTVYNSECMKTNTVQDRFYSCHSFLLHVLPCAA